MIDTLLTNLERFDVARMRSALALPERYAVATMHRPANVDEPEQAARIAAMLRGVSELVTLVVPLHPRGRPTLEAAGLVAGDRLRIVDPLGYVDFLSLVRGAALVVTDSGGIQEETTVLGVPCLTVRPNTERPITITHGTNRLVEPEAVVPAAPVRPRGRPPGAGRGPAAVGRPCRGAHRRRSWRSGSRDRTRTDAAGSPSPDSPASLRPPSYPQPDRPWRDRERRLSSGRDRPRLRGPAPGHLVRGGRPHRRGDRRPPQPRVAELNAGTSPIDDIEDARLPAALGSGLRVVAPADAAIPDADAIFVCVPTPITTTKDPDLAPVLSAAATIRDNIRRGPARDPPVHDVPGTTTGPFREIVEESGPQGRHRLRPRLRPRAGQPGRSGQRQQGRPAPRRGDHAARPRPARRRSCAGSTTRSSSCPRPTRRSSPSSSRTSSATSTSRSSTSSRCCASGWASMSGRSSTPRRRSRSGS